MAGEMGIREVVTSDHKLTPEQARQLDELGRRNSEAIELLPLPEELSRCITLRPRQVQPKPLKLFVFGESSGDHRQWRESADRRFVLAANMEEARAFAVDYDCSGFVGEVDMTIPGVMLNEMSHYQQ